MIKKIYKGKKGFYVILDSNIEAGQYTFYEVNFKKMETNARIIPEYAVNDYLKSKNLKDATLSDFENELMFVREREMDILRKLETKMKGLFDLTRHVEVRHFLHEVQHEITPLLTEGLVKTVSIVDDHYNRLMRLEDFTEEVLECIENLIELESYQTILTDLEKILYDALYLSAVSQSVVKKGQYVFDDVIEDDEDEENQEQTEEV